MKESKTIKTVPHSSSTDEIRLTAPAAWSQLTQQQLLYVFKIHILFQDHDIIKTYMLMRFCHISILGHYKEGWKCVQHGKKDTVFYADEKQYAVLLHNFDYIDNYDTMDVRLDGVQNCRAVDALLHGIPFIDYLNMEKAYQGYMMSKKMQPLIRLVSLLYRKDDGSPCSTTPLPEESLATFYWYVHIKSVFNAAFPHLFKPVTNSQQEDFDIIKSINTQIRALTDGDITKEEQVLQKDCWRALTELDAKAEQAEELKKIQSK